MTPPLIEIVRGVPTPEEVAAITAIVVTRSGAPDAARAPAAEPGRWNDPARVLRYWDSARRSWRQAI